MALNDRTAQSTRIRDRMDENVWVALRIGLVLTCRTVGGPMNDWPTVDRRLGAIADARHRDEGDLVSALLDDLSDPAVRQMAIEQTQVMVRALSEADLRKATTDAARLVDRVCPEQAFAFRAGLTLISLWVTETEVTEEQG